MDQEAALSFICKTKSGDIATLEQHLSKEMINQFELVGFIREGLNSSKKGTWQVTETANNIYNSFYNKLSWIEKLKGYYCHYVLKF